MPEHKAIFAVDVIDSAKNEARHLGVLPELVEGLTNEALRVNGVPEHDDTQFTGDGFLRAYPDRYLPLLVDAVSTLDRQLAERNHWHKPEVRLRVAVHCGPLPEERGYYRPNIDLSRLLNAPTFKQIVHRCREESLGEAFTTALILSEQAYHYVFDTALPSTVAAHEFADLRIEVNEYHERAWVRVAGVDAPRIAFFALDPTPKGADAVQEQPSTPPGTPEFSTPQRSINNGGTVYGPQVSGDHNVFHGASTTNVTNIAGENNTGIQTGWVNGDINIGGGRE